MTPHSRTTAAVTLALAVSAACASPPPAADAPPAEQPAPATDAPAEAEPAPAPAEPAADAPSVDGFCDALPGARFETAPALSGEGTEGWSVRFTEEAYHWSYGDTVDNGIWECRGGQVTGYSDEGNRARVGTYEDGVLTWQNTAYRYVGQ